SPGDSRRACPGIHPGERRSPRDCASFCKREQADRGTLPRRAGAGAAGVLEGKKCSCYPAVSPYLTRAGGTFVDVPMTEGVVDGNLVSGPAWPAHPAWLAKFLGVPGTRIEA